MLPINSLSKLKLLEIVARIKFFNGFTIPQRELLIHHTKCYQCKVGQYVQSEFDTNSDFYIVLSGEIEVLRKDKDTTIGHVKAGEFIGESSFIRRQPKSASARAIKEAIVLCMDEDTLDGLPAIIKDRFKDAVIEGMAKRIAYLSDELLTLQKDFPPFT